MSVELQWDNKTNENNIHDYEIEYIESNHSKQTRLTKNNNCFTNRLFYGDNLLALDYLLNNKDIHKEIETNGGVKLIYIDPPYNTGKIFKKNTGETCYTDKFKDISDYLNFMYPRLKKAYQLLSNDGSIYVHCDYRTSSYLKLILDEIFGIENFRNEIIWKYTGSLQPKKDFARKHDVIFRYSKSDNVKYNPVYIPYSEGTIARFDHEDEKGRYKITKRNGKEYKTYMKEGKPIEDVWIEDDIVDIPIIMKNSKENVNYPTQKPETLLERIIKSSTNDDDILLDFFMGSGTSLAVAERLCRKWIGVDNGEISIKTVKDRLNNTNFELYKIKEKEVQ